MDHGRFRNLDAMRGICALTVVLFHCDGLFVKSEIFCHGYLAVDVFFILSGFVLVHTYEKRLAEGLGVGAYMRLRLKRLAPVYWTGTLLGIAALIIIKAYASPGMFFTPVQIAGLSLMALALIPQLTLGRPGLSRQCGGLVAGRRIDGQLDSRALAAQGLDPRAAGMDRVRLGHLHRLWLSQSLWLVFRRPRV